MTALTRCDMIWAKYKKKPANYDNEKEEIYCKNTIDSRDLHINADQLSAVFRLCFVRLQIIDYNDNFDHKYGIYV